MLHKFTLSPSMLTAAFPFHFVVDQQLRVIQAGDVLRRICSDALIGSPLEHYFQIYRPQRLETSYLAIQKRKKSLFVLSSLHSKMQMKGQFIDEAEQGLMFFLGSPWITSLNSLAPLNIKLKDFATHDPIADFLFLLQAGETSLNETKKLAEELIQQQVELKNALSVKERLADIADAQAKQLEETLKDLRGTQAQLVQTEKMSSLGQMVAGVAHEINNPVNFIHANLEYVQQYTEDLLDVVSLYRQNSSCNSAEISELAESVDLDFLIKDFPRIIQSMRVGTNRIREIVTSLRTFSRLDESACKVIDIHSGLDSTLLILKHRLKGTAIEISKGYGTIPQIECYAGQLNQVFMNLLSNAIDALREIEDTKVNGKLLRSPTYIPTIFLETSAANDHVLIRIGDNGPGIPKDIQSKLFDPFFTTKAVGKGTGLGLSISYQIVVDKHGGKLWCESLPGRGTAFFVQLPRQIPMTHQNHKLIHIKETVSVSQ